uniref:Dynein axonemal assembly factor 5 TPR repeats domain-containing protein n=1 Tax=Aureoumbra lagunensis TaxID=44058 RepID=A0A7S3JT76_9STRA|mmetsp:Transcript_17975/g.27050  ORF Transcript_17975/g.27050 Transcript_17975/m.27050 type:complete len:794 (+) Transcript_17975:17-2398(+)
MGPSRMSEWIEARINGISTNEKNFQKRRENLKEIQEFLKSTSEWRSSKVMIPKLIIDAVLARLDDTNEKCREQALAIVDIIVTDYAFFDHVSERIAEKLRNRFGEENKIIESEELRLVAMQLCEKILQKNAASESTVQPISIAVSIALHDPFPDVKRASARVLSLLMQATPHFIISENNEFIQQITSNLTRKNHSKTRIVMLDTLADLFSAKYPLNEQILHLIPLHELLCDPSTSVRSSLLKLLGTLLERNVQDLNAVLLTCIVFALADNVPIISQTAFQELILAGQRLSFQDAPAQAVVTHYFEDICINLKQIGGGARQWSVTSCLLMLAKSNLNKSALESCFPQIFSAEGIPCIDSDQHLDPAALMTARLIGIRLRENQMDPTCLNTKNDVSKISVSSAHALELLAVATWSLNEHFCTSSLLQHVKLMIQEKPRLSIKQQEVWCTSLNRTISTMIDGISIDSMVDYILDLSTTILLCIQFQQKHLSFEDTLFFDCLQKLAIATGFESSSAFVERYGVALVNKVFVHVDLPLDQASWYFFLLDELAKIAPIMISTKKNDNILPMLIYHTSKNEIAYEIHMSVMALLLNAVQKSRAQYCAVDIEIILTSAVLTNLHWSPGKKMLALRKTALALLNCILEFPMLSTHCAVLSRSSHKLCNLISAHLNDSDATCRQLTTTCIGKLCTHHPPAEEDAGCICLGLVELLNDANSSVQTLACSSLASTLRVIESLKTNDVTQIAEILMLHIDAADDDASSSTTSFKSAAIDALRALSKHDNSVLTFLEKHQAAPIYKL